MTEILFGQRDETPGTCGLCSRAASPVGVLHPPGQNVLWLCELCVPATGMKVAEMNPLKLNETETQAIAQAAQQTVSDVVDAVFQQLWAAGIRDLEALNGDNYPKILAEIANSPGYADAMRATLIAYSGNIRTAVANLKA